VDSNADAKAADKKDKKQKGESKATKGKKDSQNQTEFMKPDMDAKDYNFYDRKKISTPLMPRYDLDSSVYQKGFKKKEEQQKAFTQNKYHYPARPKDQWELGLFGGSFTIAGDIKPDWTKGWGGGISVRKAINYFFSLRGSYLYGWDKTRELKPRFDVAHDGNLNGQLSNADYYHVNGPGTPVAEKIIFRNYRTMTHSVRIEGLVNLGNILFHRERTLVNVNLIAGVGAHMYRTQMDMLDRNGNEYDFSSVIADYNNLTANHVKEKDVNKAINADLDKILQGNYSVDARDPLKGGIKLAHWNIVPDFNVGVGIDFHVSKWMTIGIEENFIFNGNSNLDGVSYQSDDLGGGLTPHNDHYLASMVHLKFHLGKNRVEPLYWLNPMDYAYKKISDANPDKIAKDILKDTDEDGVPDRLDKEPATKKGCPVDVKGVILDSDKDGIPDCDDKEPFSPPGYPIDANGVAQVPPNPCCDNDTTGSGIGGDGFAGGPGGPGGPGGLGSGPNSGKGRKGRSGYDCSKIEMPGVFFDDDKYYIDPSYQSALHQVAEKLQMCPDVRMIITGVDESKNDQKYNEQLAYNRAASVVDYLVEKYGISRDRFIVKYQGGKKSNAAKTPQERKKSRRVDFGYAGDGEKGESNPPAPHPGLKAGSNK
jgi:outer membrane protein OmpA-like peptidoglycan-associated protein